jgi:hypothetical protein
MSPAFFSPRITRINANKKKISADSRYSRIENHFLNVRLAPPVKLLSSAFCEGCP